MTGVLALVEGYTACGGSPAIVRIISSLESHIDINHANGRAETRLTHLPWSSGHDFRLSLPLISAGDRGSIPRGRDFFLLDFCFAIIFVQLSHQL